METTLGKRIENIMKNNKLNQREFAEKINVKKQYVSWWVNDKVEPGYKSIARILQAFPEVDANWLIRGKNEKNGNNNIVNEQKAIYNICKECENKERTIRNLNYIIDDLKCKLNECIKKLKEKKI